MPVRPVEHGHADVAELLLRSGADPGLKDNGGEGPYDITHSEEVRGLLEEWENEATARLKAERAAFIASLLEARIADAAQRDAHARELIRQELVAMVVDGGDDAEALAGRLDDSYRESRRLGEERPRVCAREGDGSPDRPCHRLAHPRAQLRRSAR